MKKNTSQEKVTIIRTDKYYDVKYSLLSFIIAIFFTLGIFILVVVAIKDLRIIFSVIFIVFALIGIFILDGLQRVVKEDTIIEKIE